MYLHIWAIIDMRMGKSFTPINKHRQVSGYGSMNVIGKKNWTWNGKMQGQARNCQVLTAIHLPVSDTTSEHEDLP